MDVLVIGQQPGGINPRGLKLAPTISRLYGWMDRCDVRYFGFMNLMPYIDQKNPSKEDVIIMTEVCRSDRNLKVLALGNKVSDVLTRLNIRHYKLPHPSGLNRLLNDKDYEDTVIRNCREFIGR